jgi:hypothetical protein
MNPKNMSSVRIARTGTVTLYPKREFSTIFKKVFSRDSFSFKNEHLSDALTGENRSLLNITWLICLLRIRQGPGRLFLLLLIAAQE